MGATTAPQRGVRVGPDGLLRSAHETVPASVRRAHQVLDELGIWYRFSRNSKAMSCRDAAARRERLGGVGIPLWDELKSLALTDGNRLVLAHCRGDEAIDVAAVAAAVGASQLDLAPADVVGPIGFGYGLINPFVRNGTGLVPIVQVFDEALLSPIDVPGTVMTNVGDHTWGVELYGHDLVQALRPDVLVVPLAAVDSESTPRPPAILRPQKLGIITGNAPESGMVLWELMIRAVREQLGRNNVGDVSMPAVEIQSVPAMGLSMELDIRYEPVRETVEGAAHDLVAHGCTTVAVACNTTQHFGPSLRVLCEEAGASFVSMADSVGASLRAQGTTSVGLVGIRYVSDLGDWSAYRTALAGIDVERPSERSMGRITDIGYQVKAEGPTKGALGRLHNVLRDEFESRHIVLALTELSLLLDLQTAKSRADAKVLIDPLHVYAEALAATFTGATFPAVAQAAADDVA